MLTVFLIILCCILAIALGFAIRYLWKFVNIIFLFEEDISEAIDTLNEVGAALDAIMGMRLFFDSKEVKEAVSRAMEAVRVAKFSINRVAARFTQRSMQKYIIVKEESPFDELEQSQQPAQPTALDFQTGMFPVDERELGTEKNRAVVARETVTNATNQNQKEGPTA